MRRRTDVANVATASLVLLNLLVIGVLGQSRQAVPGMGRAFGGGLLEYPWWFPDMYTVQSLTSRGEFEQSLLSLGKVALSRPWGDGTHRPRVFMGVRFTEEARKDLCASNE